MNLELDLPIHIKETLEFYNSKYEMLAFQQDDGGATASSEQSITDLRDYYFGDPVRMNPPEIKSRKTK